VHNLDNVAEVSLTVDSNTILINNMIPNADSKTTAETKKKTPEGIQQVRKHKQD